MGARPPAPFYLIVSEGDVWVVRDGQEDKISGDLESGLPLDFGDVVRTGSRSRASVEVASGGVITLNASSRMELPELDEAAAKRSRLNLKRGMLYFFNREEESRMEVATPSALGAIRGTEFVVEIEPAGGTVISLLAGEIELSNDAGSVLLSGGEVGIAQPGEPPVKRPLIEAQAVIQWNLYYPAVLDPNDLALTAADRAALAGALEAYRRGALVRAYEAFPWEATPSRSPAGQTFAAALLLSVGEIDEARATLFPLPASPGKNALLEMIAAMRSSPAAESEAPATASGWLARSYTRQARDGIETAYPAALKATELAPDFGFAWSRLAEIAFALGDREVAEDAIDRALEYSPANAEAHALKGFLAVARNDYAGASTAFAQARALDPALANGWLGQGLVDYHRGETAAGRQALTVAAGVEPNRSLPRSYLGKAFWDAGSHQLAREELDIARDLDPGDPTPWLYSALLNQRLNRLNEALRDLETSIQLNDNRQLFRSQSQLDQDRSIRRANLASIYQELGMDQISLREATRSVNDDYTNSAAHLFLANSYNDLRDDRRIVTRYETPWANELLLANVFAPAGTAILPQFVGLQEYAPLFEQNELGLNLQSTYYSHGEFEQLVSQFGRQDWFSYALDFEYYWFDGYRPNNDVTRYEGSVQAKAQLSERDDVMVWVNFKDEQTGDVNLIPLPAYRRLDYELEETQIPVMLGAYTHHWSRRLQTTLLASWLNNETTSSDRQAAFLYYRTAPPAGINGVFGVPLDYQYSNQFHAWSLEANTTYQAGDFTVIGGIRGQQGELDVDSLLFNPGVIPGSFPFPASHRVFSADFSRLSAYGYIYYDLLETMQIQAGLSFDYMDYPINFFSPPLSPGSRDRTQLSPKLGWTWTPYPWMTLRTAYARSLGGLLFDQSLKLEPTQIAGFVQDFRNVVPENIAGSVFAPTLDTAGVGATFKWPTQTYVDLAFEWRSANFDQANGVFIGPAAPPPLIGTGISTSENEYTERFARISINQLLGDWWAVGGGYRYIQSDLSQNFPIESAAFPPAGGQFTQRSALHDSELHVIFNHPSGFFSRLNGRWLVQDNAGFPFFGGPPLEDEDVFMFDFFAGYRFQDFAAEVTVGVVNFTDQDYQLYALNPISEFPRERSVFVQFKLNL